MSQENVEIMRRVYDAYASRDFEAAMACFDPEIEWVNPPDALEPGTHRGIDAFANAAQTIGETFEGLRLDIDEFLDAGERVVVLATMRGRGRGSGADVERRQGYVWTLREGKVIRYEWFHHPADALEAAGLSE